MRTIATQSCERQLPLDQVGERGRHGRVDAGVGERFCEQRHRFERLDRLTDSRRDLTCREPLREELAGATVAALRRERGRDEIAGSRKADHRLRASALELRPAPDLGEDVPGCGTGRVQPLRLGRARRERRGVLCRARKLDPDRVVRLLADDAGADEDAGERGRERLLGRGRDQAAPPR